MRTLALLPIAVFAASCGGKVVVDPDTLAGSGGTSASSTSATSMSASSQASTSVGTDVATSGAGTDCSALMQAYEDALNQAAQCYACKDSDDCINGPVLPDSCNCPRGLNGGLQAQGLVQAAKDALATFQAAGCPFEACGKDCPSPGPWHCASPDPSCNSTCNSQ